MADANHTRTTMVHISEVIVGMLPLSRGEKMPAAERDWFRDIPGNRGANDEDLGMCISGLGTDNPCTRPATVRMHSEMVLCSEHAKLAETGREYDEVGIALELIDAWIWEAVGEHNNVAEDALQRVRCGLAQRHRNLASTLHYGYRHVDGVDVDF